MEAQATVAVAVAGGHNDGEERRRRRELTNGERGDSRRTCLREAATAVGAYIDELLALEACARQATAVRWALSSDNGGGTPSYHGSAASTLSRLNEDVEVSDTQILFKNCGKGGNSGTDFEMHCDTAFAHMEANIGGSNGGFYGTSY
uniref:Uncharacterized protein n=1 Tax=Oryza sativa subsp. japonica TaxID=39947 RepID=Q69T63_ORYSJ|nr:hypothetical protein [Oryza sativa Japonica Group]BAD35889.1 hypothetical protein [Oryza sativa Japonica Group]